jgi:chromate transporter
MNGTGSQPANGSASVSLRAFAGAALWLGVSGFGGSFAVTQRIRRVFVEDRKWLSEQSFLEHLAVASALPGTMATNLLTMFGLRFGGGLWAVAGAAGFLAPSVALMLGFGIEYERMRSIGALAAFLDGMGAATVGVVGAVAVDMRRAAVITRAEFAIAGVTLAALSFRVLGLLEVIALSGLVGVVWLRPSGVATTPTLVRHDTFPPASSHLNGFAWPGVLLMASGSLSLLVVFARIGVATFGGGFAMIPPIEHEVVSVRGWLDEAAFHDAIVLGQVTPGPVAIASTFIGYRVAGWWGSLAATVGMFAPPFVLSLFAARSLEVFRSHPVVQGFLRGVSPAVVGVIAAAAIWLARTTIDSPLSAVLAGVSFVGLSRFPKASPLGALAVGGIVSALARL